MNITMNKTFPLALALALAFAALCAPSLADEGHDHGAAPAVAAPVLPRFAASSELFELVGIAKDKRLTVYLDRFADNAPVKGATLALEIGGAPVAMKEVADGEFEGAMAQPLKPGLTPVTATVTAGNDTDILAGELDVHADEAPVHAHSWREYAGWSLAALAALLALAWVARRAAAARRVGGAA